MPLSIPQIHGIEQPKYRLLEAACLLEHFLREANRNLRNMDGTWPGFTELLSFHRKHFVQVDSIFRAWGTRCEVSHPDGNPSVSEMERAANALLNAAEEFVPHVPPEIAQVAKGSSTQASIPRCPQCRGRGFIGESQGFYQEQKICPGCRGTGIVLELGADSSAKRMQSPSLPAPDHHFNNLAAFVILGLLLIVGSVLWLVVGGPQANAVQEKKIDFAVAPRKKEKVKLFNIEVEGRSVVYAFEGYFYRGLPWSEMRDSVLASIDQLPDGMLFQVVASRSVVLSNSEKLVEASPATRALARDFLTKTTNVLIGTGGDSVLVSANYQPDIIFLLTNEHQPSAWSDAPRTKLAETVKRQLNEQTQVHILCWRFPGDFNYGRWSRGEPIGWMELAKSTQGTFNWIAPTSGEYFWGLGPEVEIRATSNQWSKGQLIYADKDSLRVRNHFVPTWEDGFERKDIKTLRILKQVREKDIPLNARHLFPPNSITQER